MRTIIKHANRRLYDASERRAITLLELSDIVVGGETVTVLDKASGEDITAVALLQSILERLRRRPTDGLGAGDAERLVAAVRVAMSGGSIGAEFVAPGEAAGEATGETAIG